MAPLFNENNSVMVSNNVYQKNSTSNLSRFASGEIVNANTQTDYSFLSTVHANSPDPYDASNIGLLMNQEPTFL